QIHIIYGSQTISAPTRKLCCAERSSTPGSQYAAVFAWLLPSAMCPGDLEWLALYELESMLAERSPTRWRLMVKLSKSSASRKYRLRIALPKESRGGLSNPCKCCSHNRTSQRSRSDSSHTALR